MEAYFCRGEYFYVLNLAEDVLKLSNGYLESKILEFSTGKETGETAILSFGNKEQIIHEKDIIVTILTSKAINPIIYERHYKIENQRGNIVLLNGMTYNLEY